MQILFLSRWFPFPPNNGSKLRIYYLLRGLSRYHQISLISYYDPLEGYPDLDNISNFCKDIKIVEYKPFQPISARSLRGFLSSRPRFVEDTFSEDIKEEILRTLSEKPIDLVIASQFDMAIYADFFRDIPAIFDEAEVGVLYENFVSAKSRLHKFRNKMTWEKYRRYLRRLLIHYETCTVVSEQESCLIKQAVPDYNNFEIVPNFIDLNDYRYNGNKYQPNQIIFTGSFSYYPNYEAMVWFINKVFPIILARKPDIELMITGNPADRRLPSSDNISHVGFVDDVRPFIAQSGCSIVPLHTGGGTRLKILEAMALGTPVVATSKGTEGLSAEHGVHLLIADEPEPFADAVLQTLQDHKIRQKLVRQAHELVTREYSSRIIIPRFNDLIERTKAGKSA